MGGETRDDDLDPLILKRIQLAMQEAQQKGGSGFSIELDHTHTQSDHKKIFKQEFSFRLDRTGRWYLDADKDRQMDEGESQNNLAKELQGSGLLDEDKMCPQWEFLREDFNRKTNFPLSGNNFLLLKAYFILEELNKSTNNSKWYDPMHSPPLSTSPMGIIKLKEHYDSNSSPPMPKDVPLDTLEKKNNQGTKKKDTDSHTTKYEFENNKDEIIAHTDAAELENEFLSSHVQKMTV